MNEDKKIRVIGIIKRTADKFDFVVRWFLDDFDNLPLPTDSFGVKVEWKFKGGLPSKYLKPDGTFREGEEYIPVVPRVTLMLDPPRELRQVGSGLKGDPEWKVAQTPKYAVNCNLAGPISPGMPWPVDQAFGVCHLLRHTHRARAVWAAAKIILDELPRKLDSLKSSPVEMEPSVKEVLKEFGKSDTRKDIALFLAKRLVRYGPHPGYLLQHLSALTRELRGIETRRESPRDREDILSFFPERNAANRWKFLTLLTFMFTDSDLREKLEDIIEKPNAARSAVGLRLVQGGRLLDYWEDAAGVRGIQYPASEVLGLGLTVKTNYTVAEASKWADPTSLGMVITVKQDPRQIVIDPPEVKNGLLMDNILDAELPPGSFPIETGEIATLFTSPPAPSTMPVSSPPSARISWDLVQSNAGMPEEKSDIDKDNVVKTLGFLTGDGLVEILIQAPTLKPLSDRDGIDRGADAEVRVGGFNVYGIWEDKDDPVTKPYFDDPTNKPKLSDLKKWLITRRYSRIRDIESAFAVGDVQRILADPPWLSVWHRQKEDYWLDGNLVNHQEATTLDEKPTKPEPSTMLPNEINRDFTAYSLDLRAGIPISPGRNPSPPWDQRAIVNVHWTPEKDRNFQCVDQPQRYRFFVTTIDAFEQESEPISVVTTDRDVEDIGIPEANVVFKPRRRTALLPPPVFEENNPPGDGVTGSGRGLVFDKNGRRLRVWWETPFLAANSGNTDFPEKGNPNPVLKRADKNDLIGTVVIFRRSLRTKIKDQFTEDRELIVANLKNPTTLPQWQQEIKKLEKVGWRTAKNMTNLSVDPPAAGDVWATEFPVKQWEDEGYEYVALLSVSVKEEKSKFWIGNALARHVQWVKRDTPDSDYELKDARMVETPGYSDAVITGVVALPNDAVPRKVTKLAAKFRFALPVLPPPGIYRDTVLLRLLTNSFDDPRGTCTDPPCLKTGSYPSGSPDPVMVTPGQRAMVEAAITRTHLTDPTDPLSPEELFSARTIMAADFRKPALTGESREFGLNPTIGFRGLQRLRFEYDPFSHHPKPEESEATKFRIYSVRVPLDPVLATRYATFTTAEDDDVTREGNVYSFKITPNAPNWPKILPILPVGFDPVGSPGAAGKPALVRVRSGDKQSDGVIKTISYSGGRIYIEVKFTGEAPSQESAPVPISLSLFMAQPIYELTRPFEPSEPSDPPVPEKYTLGLPVGGGIKEIFAWWIVSVSAQDNESGIDAETAVTLVRDYQTIEPGTPQFFTVSPPTDDATHFLNPTNPEHSKWMPGDVKTLAAAKALPRLLVAWQKGGDPENIGEHIAIARQERLINKEEVSRSLGSLDAWRALVRLEGASPKDLLQENDLQPIQEWLEGGTIDLPDEEVGFSDKDWHIRPEDKMSIEGVISLSFPGNPGRLFQCFIDYYLRKRSDFPNDAMDGNYEYNYRAMSFVDLGSDKQPAWRYLYSRPTISSGFRIPESLTFKISKAEDETLVENLEGPRVLFNFSTTSQFRLNPEEKIWFYRVVIRRQSPFALGSSAAVDPVEGWLTIGQPLILQQGQTNLEIIDNMIERPVPGESICLKYEILVFQCSQRNGGPEQLVRAPFKVEPYSTVIPPPSPSGGPPLECTRIMKYRIE